MLTTRTGGCSVDRVADDWLGAIGREVLETVGGSDLCGGIGRETGLGRFSRPSGGCSRRKFPRGPAISVSAAKVGRGPFDEGPRGLGGWTPLVAVWTTSDGSRLDIGSDPVGTETRESEGGLGLCGRVCFGGTVNLCSQSAESTSAVESPPALGSSFTTWFDLFAGSPWFESVEAVKSMTSL